jgi:preprotein translocase subunit SecG
MISFLIIFHIIITVLLIGAVLVQKNDSDALGGLGGSGGGLSMGGVMSTRASKSFLSRATTLLAVLFFATSLGLAVLSHKTAGQGVGNGTGGGSIADEILKQNQASPAPQAPATAPEVPLAK